MKTGSLTDTFKMAADQRKMHVPFFLVQPETLMVGPETLMVRPETVMVEPETVFIKTIALVMRPTTLNGKGEGY